MVYVKAMICKVFLIFKPFIWGHPTFWLHEQKYHSNQRLGQQDGVSLALLRT